MNLDLTVALGFMRRQKRADLNGLDIAKPPHATEGNRLNALYTVACTTGLRRGELLGLRWSDVDLDAARLRVHANAHLEQLPDRVRPPKTAKSVRSIALDPDTVAALRGWRKAQLEERLAWGSAYQDHLDLVFAREDGSPLHGRSSRSIFSSMRDAPGCP